MSTDAPTTVRVRIQNEADGGLLYWLAKLYGFGFLCLITAGLVAVVTVYGYFARQAPEPPDLVTYARTVPRITQVYAADGSLLAEFADEWREVVPLSRVPRPLIDAFLAAEDHEFFSHDGVYLKGIARAAWRNLTAGDWVQGGSTITQQVAKQFLGSEKTLSRKAKEAIVARRLEARFTKDEILAVYLNQIFLGSGAYGVQAAARRYFSKTVDQLDLGEMATIAGLAQAPSRDSPLQNPENARRRRDQVLDKMVRHGFIALAEADRWKAQPLTARPYRDVFLTTEPYFAEHVRRYLKDRYGPKAIMAGGLTVETTIAPWMDAAAYDTVDFFAHKQDRREGWRGPEAHLEGAATQTFLERAAHKYGEGPLAEGRRYLALVEKVESRQASVLIGAKRYRLPLERMRWAARWSTNPTNDRTIGSVGQALAVGDVVWVSRPPSHIGKYDDWNVEAEVDDPEKLNAVWTREHDVNVAPDEVALEQVPHPQAAILTFDWRSGYVLAMVGGSDYSRSEYNRTVQACRQPGSTYKPIYYSLALDQGYGFDTMLNDKAKAEVDENGNVWTPTNLFEAPETEVTMENAIVWSRNVPSVQIFKTVGAKNVEAWARRLGFTTEIIPDRALALGASCTRMDELARAFSIFARNGRWLDLVYVRRVLDRNGRVIEDNSVYWDGELPAAARLDRLAVTAGMRPKEVIPARTAYLTTKLLRAVVAHGHMGPVRQPGIISAGKTGTSSATMDTWFVGFTDRWLTATWLGDDLRQRPLGIRDAAYMTSVPAWARYMAGVVEGVPMSELPVEVPPGVKPTDRGGHRTVPLDDGGGARIPAALVSPPAG